MAVLRYNTPYTEDKRDSNNNGRDDDDNSNESWDWNSLNEKDIGIIQDYYGYEPNLYRDVLKIDHDAHPRDIRTAYFRRGREVLNVNHTKSKNVQEMADSMGKDSQLSFQAISAAYDILSHPERREHYDDYLTRKESSLELVSIIRRKNTVPLSLFKHRERLNNPSAALHVTWNEEVEELVINDYDPLEHSHRHETFREAARAAAVGEYYNYMEEIENEGNTNDNYSLDDADSGSIASQTAMQLSDQLRRLDEEAEKSYGRDFFDRVEDGLMELVSLASSTTSNSSIASSSISSMSNNSRQIMKYKMNKPSKKKQVNLYFDEQQIQHRQQRQQQQQEEKRKSSYVSSQDIPFDEIPDQQQLSPRNPSSSNPPDPPSSNLPDPPCSDSPLPNPVEVEEEPGHIVSTAKNQHQFSQYLTTDRKTQNQQTTVSPDSPDSVAKFEHHNIQQPLNAEKSQKSEEEPNIESRQLNYSTEHQEGQASTLQTEQLSFIEEAEEETSDEEDQPSDDKEAPQKDKAVTFCNQEVNKSDLPNSSMSSNHSEGTQKGFRGQHNTAPFDTSTNTTLDFSIASDQKYDTASKDGNESLEYSVSVLDIDKEGYSDFHRESECCSVNSSESDSECDDDDDKPKVDNKLPVHQRELNRRSRKVSSSRKSNVIVKSKERGEVDQEDTGCVTTLQEPVEGIVGRISLFLSELTSYDFDALDYCMGCNILGEAGAANGVDQKWEDDTWPESEWEEKEVKKQITSGKNDRRDMIVTCSAESKGKGVEGKNDRGVIWISKDKVQV